MIVGVAVVNEVAASNQNSEIGTKCQSLLIDFVNFSSLVNIF